MKPKFIKFCYIIRTMGNGSRGGDVFALSYNDAEKQVMSMMTEGETIYSFWIAR